MKDKKKTYFFVLKSDTLMWFSKETDVSVKGSVSLWKAAIANDSDTDKSAFVIKTLQEKLTLIAADPIDRDEWISILRKSIFSSKLAKEEQPTQKVFIFFIFIFYFLIIFNYFFLFNNFFVLGNNESATSFH